MIFLVRVLGVELHLEALTPSPMNADVPFRGRLTFGRYVIFSTVLVVKHEFVEALVRPRC